MRRAKLKFVDSVVWDVHMLRILLMIGVLFEFCKFGMLFETNVKGYHAYRGVDPSHCHVSVCAASKPTKANARILNSPCSEFLRSTNSCASVSYPSFAPSVQPSCPAFVNGWLWDRRARLGLSSNTLYISAVVVVIGMVVVG